MVFDLVSYSGWLIAALGFGLVVGWRTYLDAPRRNWRDGWIVWGALAFVIAVIVATLKLAPGRYGLWLEVALLMTAFYIVGCFLGSGLKKLLGTHETGAHESASAAAMRGAADVRDGAKLAAEQQATAKAAADRLAIEVAAKAEADRKAAAAKAEAVKAEAAKAEAAKAEADRLAAEAAARAEAERARAEIERRAAAAAKAEAERLAAATLAKAEADRLTAAAVAKALEDRRALAGKGEADRPALATVAKANGSATKTEPAKTESDRSARSRLLPLPGRRRIVLWRKPPQWPRGNEKQVPPPKPRRVVWLQRVSQRSRLGETPPSRPTRPMHRRTVWLRRLPRPRPIGAPSLRYLRRQTEQT
jgi:hypothetical protein